MGDPLIRARRFQRQGWQRKSVIYSFQSSLFRTSLSSVGCSWSSVSDRPTCEYGRPR
jgi:hypothetical protein